MLYPHTNDTEAFIALVSSEVWYVGNPYFVARASLLFVLNFPGPGRLVTLIICLLNRNIQLLSQLTVPFCRWS